MINVEFSEHDLKLSFAVSRQKMTPKRHLFQFHT